LPSSLGLSRSPTVKTTDTLKPYYCNECGAVIFMWHQFGTTFEHCKQLTSSGFMNKPKWTSFTEASPVRTSVLQELEQAWMAADQDCSMRLPDSLASYDPDSSSWKTSQLSLFGGWTEFSWLSLRWGMTRDGQLYQPQRWVPRTEESDGSYLPTPLASDCGTQNNNKGGTPKMSLPSSYLRKLFRI